MMSRRGYYIENHYKMMGVLRVSIFNSKLKSKNQSSNWLQQVDNQEVVFSISDTNIQNQCKVIGLTVEDLKIAKTIQTLVKEYAEHIAGEFYKAMCNIPEYNTIIENYSNPERWVKMHAQFLGRMFDGCF